MRLHCKLLVLLCFLGALGLLPFAGTAQADQVAIGFVSYDAFLPGVNTFTVYNLTGAQSLPPDFSVATSLNFLNSTLTLTGSSAPGSPISLGTIAPGVLLDGLGNPLAALQFDSASIFTSAIFQSTLDVTSVALADGSLLELDPNISFTLSPSGGTALEAGTDFGVIYAETAVAEVPEPNSFRLLIVGLFLLLLFRLSIFRKVEDRRGRYAAGVFTK